MWILLFNERSKHVARNIQDIFSINKISIVLTSGLCIPLELYYSCCDSKSGPVYFVSSCSIRHHLNQRETQRLTRMHKPHTPGYHYLLGSCQCEFRALDLSATSGTHDPKP